MKTEEKIIYYRDERNDDFSGFDIHVKPLEEGYQYIRTGLIFRVFEFLFYYSVMIPVVYMLQKVVCHQKFANRKVLRQARRQRSSGISLTKRCAKERGSIPPANILNISRPNKNLTQLRKAVGIFTGTKGKSVIK